MVRVLNTGDWHIGQTFRADSKKWRQLRIADYPGVE
jgi:hypothetical protein